MKIHLDLDESFIIIICSITLTIIIYSDKIFVIIITFHNTTFILVFF